MISVHVLTADNKAGKILKDTRQVQYNYITHSDFSYFKWFYTFEDQASMYRRLSKKGQPSKMGTNQNNCPDRRGNSHDSKSVFDWSKGFQDWLDWEFLQRTWLVMYLLV